MLKNTQKCEKFVTPVPWTTIKVIKTCWPKQFFTNFRNHDFKPLYHGPDEVRSVYRFTFFRFQEFLVKEQESNTDILVSIFYMEPRHKA